MAVGFVATAAAPAVAKPTAPTILEEPSAFVQGSSVIVAWGPSTFDNGTTQRQYVVSPHDLTAGAKLPTIVVSSADPRQAVVNGLVDGHVYSISVVARNTDPVFGQLTSSPLTRQFTIDSASPTGTAVINGGAAYTTSRDVTLNLSASDPGGAASGVNRMQVSTKPALSCPPVGDMSGCPKPFEPTRAVTLPDGPDGPRTVLVRFMDAARPWPAVLFDFGNVSETLAPTIVLDRVPPVAPVTQSATTVTVGGSVSFSTSPSDETSGVDPAATSWSFGDGTPAVPGSPVNHVYSGVGTFNGTLTVKDKAGLVTNTPFTVTVKAAASSGASGSAGGGAGGNTTTGPGAGSGPGGGMTTGAGTQAPLTVNNASIVGFPRGLRTMSVRVKMNRRGTATVTVSRKVRGVVKVVRRAKRTGGPGVMVVRFLAPPAGSYSLAVKAGTSTKKLRLVVVR